MIFLLFLLLWGTGWILFWNLKPISNISKARQHPSISIIIPARNEEHNISKLLTSLQSQSLQPTEIIVVDDSSEDQTAAIATASGAKVVSAPPLPDRWKGKTWACQQGADAASGSLLLFMDADTTLHPDGLSHLLNAYSTTGGVLSVLPYHRVVKPYEKLSAFFNLFMAAGTGAFTLCRHQLTHQGLFGQMILIDKTTYFSTGGHASVKANILENFALGLHLRQQGISLHHASGLNCIEMRMYPDSLHELIQGWTKGFATGATQTPKIIMNLIIAWITGLCLAFIFLIFDPSLKTTLIYLLFATQTFHFLKQLGSFGLMTALAYPVSLAFYFIVFTKSSLLKGKSVSWKGRHVESS